MKVKVPADIYPPRIGKPKYSREKEQWVKGENGLPVLKNKRFSGRTVTGKVIHGTDLHSLERQYHQGVLAIDEGLDFSHLRGTVMAFLKAFFGDLPVRFRASYFPFTEPSAEVDVQWRGRWLEVMGCGMVDPAVLEGLGLDPERYSGFAAGLGVERFCMVRHGIDDIRRLYTSDLRFLEQF